jgi:hypothetical protein
MAHGSRTSSNPNSPSSKIRTVEKLKSDAVFRGDGETQKYCGGHVVESMHAQTQINLDERDTLHLKRCDQKQTPYTFQSTSATSNLENSSPMVASLTTSSEISLQGNGMPQATDEYVGYYFKPRDQALSRQSSVRWIHAPAPQDFSWADFYWNLDVSMLSRSSSSNTQSQALQLYAVSREIGAAVRTFTEEQAQKGGKENGAGAPEELDVIQYGMEEHEAAAGQAGPEPKKKSLSPTHHSEMIGEKLLLLSNQADGSEALDSTDRGYGSD